MPPKYQTARPPHASSIPSPLRRPAAAAAALYPHPPPHGNQPRGYDSPVREKLKQDAMFLDWAYPLAVDMPAVDKLGGSRPTQWVPATLPFSAITPCKFHHLDFI